MALDEREAISDPRMLVQGLGVLALVIAGFVLHPVLHYEPSIVALLGAGLLVAVSTVETGEVLAEVEWPTLAFFAGLFIMIGGLIETGVIGEVSKALADAVGDNELGGSMLLLGASAVLSGVVDNIPYVATMAPITSDLVHPDGRRQATTSCGGPWPSAPTSAATPPPSAPPPTSSSSASPNATASPSPSGSSPSTAWSSPPSPSPLRGLPVAALLRPGMIRR